MVITGTAAGTEPQPGPQGGARPEARPSVFRVHQHQPSGGTAMTNTAPLHRIHACAARTARTARSDVISWD
ncbi:hypothetical protein PL81_30100 [Streptomyces sp. RSD-27]|nr:hypothetical protein PL81_30100 [Streptomyces sp. RSD-27]